MLTIYDERQHFWQWDTDQRLVVEDGVSGEVHFRNLGGGSALTVETYKLDGKTVVDVPNILLQKSDRIYAWVYVGDNRTIHEKFFDVWPRQKPADYVYTETEIKSYETLEKRVKDIEDGGGASGLFIVKHTAVSTVDKTPEEIRAAVADGKICVLEGLDGRVSTYYGDTDWTDDSGVTYSGPTFVTTPYYDDAKCGFDTRFTIVREDGKVYFRGQKTARTTNPAALALYDKATGELHTYDGSKTVFVELPKGGGSAEVTTESITNALGYTPAQQPKYAQPDWGAETSAGVLYDGELMLADAEQSAEELLWGIPKIPLDAGKTYTVTWMGTQYECIARSIVLDGIKYVLLGNTWIIDGVTSDDPFGIVDISADTEHTIVIGIRVMDAAESVPMAIEENGTIHKIPAVYVDGNGEASGVEIDATLTKEGAAADAKATGDAVARLSEEIAFKPDVWGVDVLYLNGDTTGMTKDDAKDLTFVWGERSGNVSTKLQGSSSIQTGVEIGSKFDTELGGLFNFTLKFEEGFEAKEGWGVQKKYVFKVNAIDHSHARNLCSCKLWGQIVKSRKNGLTELSSLVNGGAVDGFPMIVMLNGKYYAFGTFNIPKDGWMFGAPKAILCADKGMTATAFKALADMQNDFELEYVEDENDADWVLSSLNRAIQAVIDSDGSDLYTTVDQYVDIRSAIDYYIHNVDENGSDAMYKNYILVTFDKVKWYFSAYDRDTTYGLWWNGKGFDSPVGGVTYASYAGNHRLMNLIYRFDNVNLKKRAIELRDGIKSVSNVANVFTNFAAAIPSEVLAHNARRWPLLRSTNASNTAQIVNWYGIRRVAIDAEIESMTGKVEISGNLVPHALAIDSDEVYNGVGYKNDARWANTDQREHASVGYVAVGRIPCAIYADMIDVTEETYIYIKGDIVKPFDDIMDFILYWDASGQLVTFANSTNAKAFYDVVQLDDNYWRISLKASTEFPKVTAISLSRGNDVLRVASMCISFKGVGEGLTITVGEPIE